MRHRVLREGDGPVALRGAAADLGGAQLGIPQLADDHRHEHPGHRRAPLVDHEVVVGPDAEVGERLVLELVEQHAAEAGQRREAQAGADPVGEHVPGPLVGVVATGDHVAEPGGLHVPLLLRLAGHGVQPHGHVPGALVDPDSRPSSSTTCGPASCSFVGSRSVQTVACSMTWSSTLKRSNSMN